MKYDDLIKCDRCGGDACYHQEVNAKISTYFCYGCGFQTNTLMRKGQDFYKEQMEILPNLYKELMGEDEDGKVWMPSTINIPEKGMIFANGVNAQSWKWASIQAIPIEENDENRHKYKIPGTVNEYYKHKTEMDTMKEFDEKDFMDALSYINIFPK